MCRKQIRCRITGLNTAVNRIRGTWRNSFKERHLLSGAFLSDNHTRVYEEELTRVDITHIHIPYARAH